MFSPTNRLFELARTARLRPSFVPEKLYPIPVLVFGLIAPIVAQICMVITLLPVLLVVGFSPETLERPATDAQFTLVLIMAFLPLYLVVAVWLWLFEQRALWTIGLEWAGGLKKYARGVIVGLALFGGTVALLALFGLVAPETGEAPVGIAAIGGVSLLVLGWVVQGAAEEVLTRGFLLPVVSVRYGPVLGIILSSSVFAILHLLNPNVSVIAILNLFLFGVFAALYALYEESLWGICAIHSVWNWAQGNLFGFEVSGTNASYSTLFNLAETGPDWITGGAFGPEGGLAVTLILLIGCGLVWMAKGRKPQNVAPLGNTTVTL